MTDELTPEERKQMHESRSWSCAPEPGERSQAGDAVPCPRCHRGAVMHNSKKPCVFCQLKAADTRIAELEKAAEAEVQRHRSDLASGHRCECAFCRTVRDRRGE